MIQEETHHHTPWERMDNYPAEDILVGKVGRVVAEDTKMNRDIYGGGQDHLVPFSFLWGQRLEDDRMKETTNKNQGDGCYVIRLMQWRQLKNEGGNRLQESGWNVEEYGRYGRSCNDSCHIRAFC